MPVGGKLVLKGGLQVTSSGVGKVAKKKKKKSKSKDAAAVDAEGSGEQKQPSDKPPPRECRSLTILHASYQIDLRFFSHQACLCVSSPLTSPPAAVKQQTRYEEEFALEMEKSRQGKAKSTPWGSGFRAAPEVLHGYDRKVTGKTAEERLDMRAAVKADKFCR